MHPIKHFSFLFMSFLISMLISACGSRGDLYEVAKPEVVQKTVVKPAQLSNEDNKKKQP